MRKTLIALLIVVSLLLAAAVGFLIYMENDNDSPETTGPAAETTMPVEVGTEQTDPVETDPVETTEETLGFSLPTEDPDEVLPEQTFPEQDQPDATEPTEGNAPAEGTEPSVDPDATFDPDENETPEMPV